MNNEKSIAELSNLPISQLTDEEIARVICSTFKSRFALLAYESEGEYLFLSTYASGGKSMIANLQKAWEAKFGKVKEV